MSTFFDRLTNPNQNSIPSHADASSSREISLKRPSVAVKRPLAEADARMGRPVVEDEPPPLSKLEIQEHMEEETRQEEIPEEEGELTVDIYDKGEKIVIQSTVAGVKPEHLDVSITDDTVTIRGKRDRLEDVPDENYFYKELFWGSFSRSVILPEEIEQEAAQAQLQHGLLTIHLPKKRKGSVQKLKVKVV